jgi:hypothetical protein
LFVHGSGTRQSGLRRRQGTALVVGRNQRNEYPDFLEMTSRLRKDFFSARLGTHRQDTRDDPRTARRMLKKAVQQGRSFATDPRFTFHASRFTIHDFSILLVRWRQHRNYAQRAAGAAGNFHRQGDHVESLIRKIA